jgi:acyl dehydratase
MVTAKQREFEYDFIKDAASYEVWAEVEIGREYEAKQKFLVKEEDILSYNLGVLESDPLFTEPDHARQHSPTGTLLQHPLFLVQMAFYCIEKGPGNWIRTPGARNPGQRIEWHEPFQVGEEITMKMTAWDKWVRRGKYYLTYKCDFYNEDGVLKASWWATLILPPTREEVLRFAAMEEAADAKV